MTDKEKKESFYNKVRNILIRLFKIIPEEIRTDIEKGQPFSGVLIIISGFLIFGSIILLLKGEFNQYIFSALLAGSIATIFGWINYFHNQRKLEFELYDKRFNAINAFRVHLQNFADFDMINSLFKEIDTDLEKHQELIEFRKPDLQLKITKASKKLQSSIKNRENLDRALYDLFYLFKNPRICEFAKLILESVNTYAKLEDQKQKELLASKIIELELAFEMLAIEEMRLY